MCSTLSFPLILEVFVCLCVCVFVCVCVCVCVLGERSSYSEAIINSIAFFIYLDMNTIYARNNFIHQSKSSFHVSEQWWEAATMNMTSMIWNDCNLNFIIDYQPNNQQTLDIFVLILFKHKNLKNKW